MFCHNCGNKLEGESMVCLKCGCLVQRGQYKKISKKKNSNVQGIISLIFGIISILLSFNLMLKDISNVGMYTKLFDRLYYAIDIAMAPLFLSFITLVISSNGKNKEDAFNKTGLFLSIISLFFIVSEIVIVIIY